MQSSNGENQIKTILDREISTEILVRRHWRMGIRVLPILVIAIGVLIGRAESVSLPTQDILFTNLPSSFYERDFYQVDPYIRAAGQLQDMGREAATGQLLKLAETAAVADSTANEHRIAILCRMLFIQRHGSTFERPAFLGAGAFFGEDFTFESKSYTNWPSEPIELVDGVPFAIVYGYSYQGFWNPHSAESYVRYCMTNCDWSSIHFTSKSQDQ